MTSRANNNNPAMFPAGEILPPAPVFLIRHAQKEGKNGMKDAQRRITAQGRESSREAGKAFKNACAAPFYVSHSPVMRCRETACLIAGELGAESIKECGRLEGYPDFAESREAKEKSIEEAGKSGKKFGAIVDELGERGRYENFPSPCLGAANFCAFLMESARDGVNICVSHDWVIYLTARFIGATAELFSAERPCFLESLCLWQEGEKVKFFYRGRVGVSKIILPPRKS